MRTKTRREIQSYCSSCRRAAEQKRNSGAYTAYNQAFEVILGNDLSGFEFQLKRLVKTCRFLIANPKNIDIDAGESLELVQAELAGYEDIAKFAGVLLDEENEA